MSQFPSPADSAAGSGFQTSPKSLYPDLTMADPEEDDILVALGAPPSRGGGKKPPRRPPPPRSQSLPQSLDPPVPGVAVPPDNVSQSLPPARPHAPPSYSKASSESNLYVPPPLHSHKVRWFYQEHGKYWQPFNGQDSLTLEDCYRRMQSDGEQGSSAASYEVTVLGDMYEVNLVENTCKPIYWAVDKTPWTVLRGYWFEVVGDKWYPLLMADYELIEREHCQKKWREKARKDAELQLWATANAGTASPSNSPGIVHRQNSNSGAKKPQSPQEQPNPVDPSSTIVNKLTHTKYDVLWMSNGDIIKMKRELTSQLLNRVGEKFGKGSTTFGTSKLVRGYKDPASREDRMPPIGHVVFVIHGIGQNMDISCITKSTNDLRDTAMQVAKKCFKDEWEEKRVEFLPVEWRTWLTLDKGMIGNITLHGVPMMRRMINDSVLDVMYYLSPKFRPEILDGLKFQLHKQYNAFMKHHPNFLSTGGTVSIIGHSLGSVISYDLLLHTAECMGVEVTSEPESPTSTSHSPSVSKSTMVAPRAVQLADGKGAGGGGGGEGVRFDAKVVSPEASLRLDDEEEEPTVIGEDEPDSTAELERQAAIIELEQLKKRVAELEEKLQGKKKKGGLKFKVDHFFALGSPLGMFLAMREHETLVKKNYKGAASILPACVCKRIHNLHHPSDPVAYRLEPLVNKLYANIKPVKVDSAGSKPSKDLVDMALGPRTQQQLQTQSKGWLDTFSQWVSGSKKPASQGNTTDGGKPKPDKVVDNDDKLHPEEKLRERLDFMLREGFVENSYMNSITAHNGYWSSSECAQFILLQIYKFRQGGCS